MVENVGDGTNSVNNDTGGDNSSSTVTTPNADDVQAVWKQLTNFTKSASALPKNNSNGTATADQFNTEAKKTGDDAKTAASNASSTPSPTNPDSDFTKKLDSSKYSSTDPNAKYDSVTTSQKWVATPGGGYWTTSTTTQSREPLGADYKQLAKDDAQAKELARPVSAAAELKDQWKQITGDDKGTLDLNNPPANLTQDQKDLIKYIKDNLALATALDGGSNPENPSDGKITAQNVDDFIGKMETAAKTAGKEYQDFLNAKHDPALDDMGKEMARQAMLLKANAPLLAMADPASAQRGNAGGGISANGLKAAAANNPGLSPALQDAARMFSQSSMYKSLETGGNNPTSKPDGVASVNDLSDWMKNACPANNAQFQSMMSKAAMDDAVAGTDTSTLAWDKDKGLISKDGNTAATTEQKAAALNELLNARNSFVAGVDAGRVNDAYQQKYGLNCNPEKVIADIDGKIKSLQGDKEVMSYLNSKTATSLQSLMQSDKAVMDTAKTYFNDKVLTGSKLNDDIKAAGTDAAKMNAAINSFQADVNFYSTALGKDGKSISPDPTSSTAPNLARSIVANNPDLTQNLEKFYKEQVVTGKVYGNPASGTDAEKAATLFNQSQVAFAGVLSNKALADNATQLKESIDTASLNSLGKDADVLARLKKAADDPNIEKALTEAFANMPEGMYKNGDGKPISASDAVNLGKSLLNSVRNGEKLEDAIAKLKDQKLPMGVYGSGALHLANTILSGVAYGVKLGETAKNGSSENIIKNITGGIQLFATAGETSAKMTGAVLAENEKNLEKLESQLKREKDAINGNGYRALDDNQLAQLEKDIESKKADIARNKAWMSVPKNVEASFKALGGAAGILAGGMGIASGIESLSKGDIVNGAFSTAAGVTGFAAGVCGVVEGLGSIAGANVAGVAAVGAGLGIASAAIAIAGVAAAGLAEGIKYVNDSTTYYDTYLKPAFSKYGVTGGDNTSGDYQNVTTDMTKWLTDIGQGKRS